jgi:hypothetical protein
VKHLQDSKPLISRQVCACSFHRRGNATLAKIVGIHNMDCQEQKINEKNNAEVTATKNKKCC